MNKPTFLHPPEKPPSGPWAAAGNLRSGLAGPQLAEALITAGMTPGGLEEKVPLYFISRRTAGHDRGTHPSTKGQLSGAACGCFPCGSWGCVLMTARLMEYSKRK